MTTPTSANSGFTSFPPGGDEPVIPPPLNLQPGVRYRTNNFGITIGPLQRKLGWVRNLIAPRFGFSHGIRLRPTTSMVDNLRYRRLHRIGGHCAALG